MGKEGVKLLAWGAEAGQRCWEPEGGVVCNVMMR